MVMIGYLSFYFELERTSDRAVVVLTTILVIATMTSSMQEVSTYEHLINLNVLPNVTIDANYRICQKPLTIN